MRRKLIAVGLAHEAALSLSACLDFGDTTFVNGQNQGAGGTGPTPIVTPTPVTCAVTRLGGGIFGDRGGAACVGRIGNRVPVGCIAQGTVTPKLNDGSDAPPAVHGTNVSIQVIQGNALALVSEQDDQPFNYDFLRTAPGLVQLKATLTPLGCPPIERVYDFP